MDFLFKDLSVQGWIFKYTIIMRIKQMEGMQMKLDHFVVNVYKKYQKNGMVIDNIRNMNFPYEPKWGKGTK